MDKKVRERITAAIVKHREMVSEFETDALETIVAAAGSISKALKQGNKVYVCGNGGSAADAQHIACELVGRFARQRRGLAVISLTTDTSVLTSVSNDYGYENVFARQVEALVAKGDILWAISTSGSSANVVAAAEVAKEKGALILAFTGREECELAKTADVCFCAESETSYRCQEIHQLAYHIVCELVEESLLDNPKENG